MKTNPWIRRAVVGGLLLAPGLAWAAMEMSGGGDGASLCSMLTSLFSCGGGCPYGG